MSGHTLTATSDGNAVVYSMTTNVTVNTANQRLLFATPGFALLPGGVTPDYTIPVEFFDPNALIITINFAGFDQFSFAGMALPTDGVLSMLRDNSTAVNSPTNFAGDTGELDLPLFASGFEDLP